VNKAKATTGITAPFLYRDQIEEGLCDLDVGLEIPFGVGAKMERLRWFLRWRRNSPRCQHCCHARHLRVGQLDGRNSLLRSQAGRSLPSHAGRRDLRYGHHPPRRWCLRLHGKGCESCHGRIN